MPSSPPPPYPGNESGNEETLKIEVVAPEKKPLLSSVAVKCGDGTGQRPPTNPPIEMTPVNPQLTQRVSNAPLEYATAPNTPLPSHRYTQAIPIPGQSVQQVISPALIDSPQMPCVGSPPTIQPRVAYATIPAVMGGYPSAPIPMQQVYPQSETMQANAIGFPGATGPSSGQAGAINLIVNTNTSPNRANQSGRVAAPTTRPAPRSCPKCRMGYITRGQARFRETCIKALAYATICCTCLLPLRLLRTNYVDKCSYCGEEYGFRGELFEKPKSQKT